MKAHDFAKQFASLPEDAEVIVSSGRLSILHEGRSFPVLDVSGHEQNASFPHKTGRAVEAVKDWAKAKDAQRADAAKDAIEAKESVQPADNQTPVSSGPAPETA